MKRIIITILIFVIGLGFILYPIASNLLNEINGSKAIQELTNEVNNLSDNDLEIQRQLAEEYNNNLTGQNIRDPFVQGSGVAMPENYAQVLNFANGIMGYIEIPKINIKLAIYHGVSDDVLAKGIGHMSDSAIPIGGPGNHSVLTGHTGLSQAKLFTDLTELTEGDLFYIHILNETHAYKVNQILVVNPEDTSALVPVYGKDYITLVTCTPYAVNTHRLLVRGERTEYIEEEKESIKPVSNDTLTKKSYTAIISGALIVLLPFSIILLSKKIVRMNKKNEKDI